MTAITDVVYFCGYKPEHFTGWGGTGSPVYTTVVASDASEANKLGYLDLYTGSPGTYPNPTKCLWGTFLDSTGAPTSTNSVWITVQMSVTGGYNSWNVRDAEDTGAVVCHAGSNYAILITPGTAASSNLKLWDGTASKLGPTLGSLNFSVQGAATRFYINVTGGGTTTGNIAVYNSSGVLTCSYSADLSNYKDFWAVSFSEAYGYDDGTYDTSNLYYAYVTNYDPRQSYLIYDTGTAAATKKDWSGNNSTFNTYPLNYLTTADGYYTTTVGDEVTFAASNTTVSVPAGFEVRTVFTSDAMVCGANDTGVAVEGIVYDTTTATELTTSTAFTLSPTGSNFFQTLYNDPITGKPWTTDGFNNYEFGVKRTS